VYFGPLTKNLLTVVLTHPIYSFSNDRISGVKGLCCLKMLSLLEGDDSLLISPICGTPPREVIPKRAAVRWHCSGGNCHV